MGERDGVSSYHEILNCFLSEHLFELCFVYSFGDKSRGSLCLQHHLVPAKDRLWELYTGQNVRETNVKGTVACALYNAFSVSFVLGSPMPRQELLTLLNATLFDLNNIDVATRTWVEETDKCFGLV